MKGRFQKLFGVTNWKYILGELTLIVLGISMALWFNNLNQQRQERQLERKLLAELKTCLTQDMQDAKGNMQIHASSITTINTLFQALSTPNTNPDTLVSYLFNAGGWTFLISNISAYEAIQSAGLQIITNDSLRNKISTLYTGKYKYIYEIEEKHYRHRENLFPLFSQIFRYQEQEINIPEDELERNRHQLITALYSLRNTHFSLVANYEQSIIPELEELINQIKEELY